MMPAMAVVANENTPCLVGDNQKFQENSQVVYAVGTHRMKKFSKARRGSGALIRCSSPCGGSSTASLSAAGSTGASFRSSVDLSPPSSPDGGPWTTDDEDESMDASSTNRNSSQSFSWHKDSNRSFTRASTPDRFAGSDSPPDTKKSEMLRMISDPNMSRNCAESLADASSKDFHNRILQALHGHVLEVMRCPEGNEVLQACIIHLAPEQVQFVLDEIADEPGSAIAAARHRFACRVLQRALKHCTKRQLAPLTEELLSEACWLARHPFSHFVLQHVVRFGSEDQQYRLVRKLEQNAGTVCLNRYGGRLIRTALEHVRVEDGRWLARAIEAIPGLLQELRCTKQGMDVATRVWKVLGTGELSRGHERL